MILGIICTYVNLKKTLPQAFPAQNIQWILERDLYDTMNENNEESLQFKMKKIGTDKSVKYYHELETRSECYSS